MTWEHAPRAAQEVTNPELASVGSTSVMAFKSGASIAVRRKADHRRRSGRRALTWRAFDCCAGEQLARRGEREAHCLIRAPDEVAHDAFGRYVGINLDRRIRVDAAGGAQIGEGQLRLLPNVEHHELKLALVRGRLPYLDSGERSARQVRLEVLLRRLRRWRVSHGHAKEALERSLVQIG
jgi:hypothetical protein